MVKWKAYQEQHLNLLEMERILQQSQTLQGSLALADYQLEHIR